MLPCSAISVCSVVNSDRALRKPFNESRAVPYGSPDLMRLIVRCVLSAVLIAFVSAAAFAQRGSGGGRTRAARPGTGDVTEHFVVWKYLEPGVEPDKEPLVVEWLPASQREMEHSPLLDAERLADYEKGDAATVPPALKPTHEHPPH